METVFTMVILGPYIKMIFESCRSWMTLLLWGGVRSCQSRLHVSPESSLIFMMEFAGSYRVWSLPGWIEIFPNVLFWVSVMSWLCASSIRNWNLNVISCLVLGMIFFSVLFVSCVNDVLPFWIWCINIWRQGSSLERPHFVMSFRWSLYSRISLPLALKCSVNTVSRFGFLFDCWMWFGSALPRV